MAPATGCGVRVIAVSKLVGMQVDSLEVKVIMAQDSPGFATVSALEALEEVVNKIGGSTNAKDMERKLETLRFINIQTSYHYVLKTEHPGTDPKIEQIEHRLEKSSDPDPGLVFFSGGPKPRIIKELIDRITLSIKPLQFTYLF